MKFLAGIFAIVFAAVMIHGQGNDLPAFHATPPQKGAMLPPVLNQAQLAESGYTAPVQTESYKAVAKMPAVMYQQPCYCFCDRHAGHTSLHSCFETTHGANCGTCMAEALYAYKMSKKGWSPKMIRDAIIRQDFKQMDLQHPEPVN